MHARFSKRVDAVVKAAHTIAHDYDTEWVGTEHILLSILNEGTGVGAKILNKHGVTTEKLKAEIDKLIKQSMEETWVFGRLPGTPHFKNVIALAVDVAKRFNSGEVCTEHVLLALLNEKGSVASSALNNLGITAEIIEAELNAPAA